MRSIIITLFLMLSACAGLTPGVEVARDPYDNTKTVTQAPVSAAASLSESWHTLGFMWSEKWPDDVIITVGMQGIDNIMNVEFNADGVILNRIKAFDLITNYADSTSGWSLKNFRMPLDDFKKIASASLVKMKVSQINTYTVSSFGKSTSATINPKFEPFLSAISN